GGLAEVGAAAFLGMGATVIDRVTIGEGATVAAGSLVNHDVPAGGRVAGAPARLVGRGLRAGDAAPRPAGGRGPA
ncbi:MAG: hypothetical protein H6Q10_3219, partial [Acidobacteria bacterium]|nr:hypothetical protein [Acidobacteriota bacterium]